MSGIRWPRALVLASLVMLGATWRRDAHAQVFKPRGPIVAGKAGQTAQTGRPGARKRAPVGAAPAAASSRKPTRAPGPTPRRVVTTSPGKKPRAGGKGQRRSDTVVIDSDDDVKIHDD